MEIEEARKLGNELIKKHNLVGWIFRFDRSKTRCGCCHHSKKTITISPYYTLLNDINNITDTILHEISHALVGHHNGHNSTWKSKCLEIGCSPKRVCSNDTKMPKDGKYKKICPNCGFTQVINRKPKSKTTACKRCCQAYNNGKWSEKFMWKVVRNE